MSTREGYLMLRPAILVFVLLICASIAPAEVISAAATASAIKPDSQPHPIVPDNSDWAGVMLIIVAALFLMAGTIGVVVWVNTPEEVPPFHSHDEPPGSSGHHGKSGTVDRHDRH